MQSTWDKVKSNLVWRIVDGQRTHFWTDTWVQGLGPLKDYVVESILDHMIDDKIWHYVTENAIWARSRLQKLLPSCIMDAIEATKITKKT